MNFETADFRRTGAQIGVRTLAYVSDERFGTLIHMLRVPCAVELRGVASCLP